MSPTPSSIYAESRVALLTQHGKEGVIASVLDTALGCRVERVTGYALIFSAPSPTTFRAPACSFPVCRSGSPARARSAPDPLRAEQTDSGKV